MTTTFPLLNAGWLQAAPLPAVLAMLAADGEEARVVGGAVRNALLGEPLGDIDIATTTKPGEVIRRAEAAGLKAIPTGFGHGTVTVVAHGQPFEVTTLRADVATDGRWAQVAFGRDWAMDAARRDFTINAFSVGIDARVHDSVGGRADLEARRIRFIGDPAKRIAEDYLRVLRFFRFHAQYGRGAPDADGLHAVIVARAGMRSLSRERIRAEMMKLLVADRVVDTVRIMAEAGLVTIVTGNVPLVSSLGRMVAIEAALEVERSDLRRLAALCCFTADDADRLRDGLRLANVEHDRLAAMAEGWWRPTAGEDEARALLYALGPQSYLDRTLLSWARSASAATDPRWQALASLPSRWEAPVFPLKAAHFIDRSIPKGPLLGRVMAAAERRWIEAGFPEDGAALAKLAEAAIASMPRHDERVHAGDTSG